MDATEIYRQTLRHFLAPIRSLLDDPEVSEILINGHETIYFERGGRLELSTCRFPDQAALLAAIRNVAEYVNRRIEGDDYSLDARLPDGSRVHVIVPPSARQGAHVSIRKFQRATLSLARLVELGSLSSAAAEFLELVVKLHKNTIVSGGTGTGKTSLLAALSAAVPDHERIIVIEDSSELSLHQPHTVYLEAQPPRPDGRGEITIRDLFVNSLRMRPDRIIMGEVRRGEALDMIQSMLSGHSGALTTVHASTPRDALARLETLSLMAGIELPVYVARQQVASAVQVIVQLVRLDDGSRRVHQISEVRGLDEQGSYVVADLFRFRARGRGADGKLVGALEPTGERPSFAGEPHQLGLGGFVRLTAEWFGPPPDGSE